MKDLFRILMLLLAAALLSGMGGVGGQPAGKTPETSEDIKAQLVDRQGVAIELTQFSMDGNVSIQGDIGSGDLSLPLSRISRIEFGELRGEKVPVVLHLKSTEKVELDLRKRAIFYGKMGDGAYRIRADEVREIVLR